MTMIIDTYSKNRHFYSARDNFLWKGFMGINGISIELNNNETSGKK